MSGPQLSGKPFDISKQEVWRAYQKVKANKGAPGVDDCSVEAFEKDLKNNLYKICKSDVFRQLLPAAGVRRGDTEVERRSQGVRSVHRG